MVQKNWDLTLSLKIVLFTPNSGRSEILRSFQRLWGTASCLKVHSPCLEPDPLLTLRKEPVVARGTLSRLKIQQVCKSLIWTQNNFYLHKRLVTSRDLVQVIWVVIVVTTCAKELESEITWNLMELYHICRLILYCEYLWLEELDDRPREISTQGYDAIQILTD